MRVNPEPPNRPAAPVAAVAAGLAATGLLAPWWQATRPTVLLGEVPTPAVATDVLRGADLLGAPATALLACLTGLTVLAAAARAGRLRVGACAGPLAVATGAAYLAALAVATVPRGGAGGLGGWAGLAVTALAGGLTVAAGAVLAAPPDPDRPPPRNPARHPTRQPARHPAGAPADRRRTLALAVVAALAAGGVLAAAPPAGASGTVAAGPFRQVADFDAPALRSGLPGLPGALSNQLVAVGSGSAVAGFAGLARVDEHGRAEVLARFDASAPDYRPTGVVAATADRVAWTPDHGTVAVRGLHPDAAGATLVTGVAETGRGGPDGVLLLRADADPTGTFRMLDLRTAPVGTLAASALPAVVFPAVTPLDQAVDLRPVAGDALRVVGRGAGYQLQRLRPAPAEPALLVLAGGLDPDCGLTRSGPLSYLPGIVGRTMDSTGALWFVVDGRGDEPQRLVRLSADGELRAVAHPLPGAVDDLVATDDGGIDLLVAGPDRRQLWRLPDAAAALSELPAPPPGCAAAPAPPAPPAQLTPVATVAGDPLGTLLTADGRWASAAAGIGSEQNPISVVAPDGTRTPLGPRLDGNLGWVWPDGSGGAWWLESPRDEPNPVTLVHALPGGEQRRFPPVPHPAPREGSTLLPDLGGRPPLLGTAVGAFRIDEGRADLVVPGPVAAGAVRADGRGWVLADGRLVALDRGRVTGPVIDAGAGHGSDTPVVVQLARGVAPAALALPRARLALDQRGRAIVVSDGTALAVDTAGRVRVVAQDDRLDDAVTVAGGLAVFADGTWQLVRLPQ